MEILRSIAKRIAELSYPRYPISREAIEKFASILVKIDLKKGQRFLDKDEVFRYIGYVEKGMIRQFYYKHDKELTEHFATEDTIFICIESFLRQKPAKLLAEAMDHTIVYGIPYDKVQELGKEDYEVETIYRGLLEDSLILSQHKMDSMRFETAVERYQRLLREQPEVIRRAPLSTIASYLLMTPETLSRVRASLV